MGLFDFFRKDSSDLSSSTSQQLKDEKDSIKTSEYDNEGIPTLESRISKAFPSKNGYTHMKY